MKSNFLKFLFLFCFLPCLYGDNFIPKMGYVLNVNGLPVYKSMEMSLKSGVLKFKDNFEIEYSPDERWIEIRRKGEIGYIRRDPPGINELLIFRKPREKFYFVTTANASGILEEPFLNSKKISNLEEFKLFEIDSYSEGIETKLKPLKYNWYQVKTTDGKIGFIYDSSPMYHTLELASSVVEKKIIAVNQYALVLNENYIYKLGNESVHNSQGGNSKKGEFIFIRESLEFNGQRYFHFSMDYSSKDWKMQADIETYNDLPFAGWISQKDVKLFSNEDFSRYTIEDTASKVNRNLLIQILAQNKDIPLNFMNINFVPLPKMPNTIKEKYFLISLHSGYANQRNYGSLEKVTFLVKKDGKEYFVYPGDLANNGKYELCDLDKDGVPEIFYTPNTMSRISFSAPSFFAYHKEAFQEIPLPGEFSDIYKVDNKYLYLRIENKKNKYSWKKYKYANGKFFEIKNK